MGSSPISSFHPASDRSTGGCRIGGRETRVEIEHCMFIDFAYAFG
ncbi:MAG: hypothetical protein ACK6DC_19010 [Planctomycetota bacterium]